MGWNIFFLKAILLFRKNGTWYQIMLKAYVPTCIMACGTACLVNGLLPLCSNSSISATLTIKSVTWIYENCMRIHDLFFFPPSCKKKWIPKQPRAPPMRQVGGRFSIKKLLWWRRFFRQDLMQGCVCCGSTWIYQLGQLGACCNLPRQVKNTFLDLARSVSFGWAFVAWDWHDIFCCIFVREQFER